jgi:hypothetical protein
MRTFRLPRKTKKRISGKCWLYPADEKGNRLWASPDKNQTDYSAMKQGVVKDLLNDSKRRAERKRERVILDTKIEVSDDLLRKYVDHVFIDHYRSYAYNTLLRAKNNPKAVIAYYNFINAYQLNDNDNSYGNTCCMTVERAGSLLRKSNIKQ